MLKNSIYLVFVSYLVEDFYRMDFLPVLVFIFYGVRFELWLVFILLDDIADFLVEYNLGLCLTSYSGLFISFFLTTFFLFETTKSSFIIID